MKRFITSVVVVIAGAVLTTGFSPHLFAYQDEQAGSAKAVNPAKPRPYPFRGKIGAINKEAGSITIPGKEKSRTVYITSATKIQKHGKLATLQDAVVGEEVGGTIQPDANGKLIAKSVRFGPKPASEKKSSKPKKEKDS